LSGNTAGDWSVAGRNTYAVTPDTVTDKLGLEQHHLTRKAAINRDKQVSGFHCAHVSHDRHQCASFPLRLMRGAGPNGPAVFVGRDGSSVLSWASLSESLPRC
jgi:hypothetical protein